MCISAASIASHQFSTRIFNEHLSKCSSDSRGCPHLYLFYRLPLHYCLFRRRDQVSRVQHAVGTVFYIGHTLAACPSRSSHQGAQLCYNRSLQPSKLMIVQVVNLSRVRSAVPSVDILFQAVPRYGSVSLHEVTEVALWGHLFSRPGNTFQMIINRAHTLSF